MISIVASKPIKAIIVPITVKVSIVIIIIVPIWNYTWKWVAPIWIWNNRLCKTHYTSRLYPS